MIGTLFGKKHVNVQNDRGFTLLEALVAFSIFCMIVSFIPLMIRTIIQEKPLEIRAQRMEWEVFIAQIKKEVRMSKLVSVSPQNLLLDRDGKIIIYEKYQSNIRRRVDFKGHEIILQNVEFFQFEKIPNGVRLQVVDGFGKEFQEEVHTFIREGET